MLDKDSAGAWRDFHERLVQVITGWQGDNIFRIGLDHASTEEGEAPFVELNFVRPQVVVEVASNRTLAAQWRLTRTQQAMIRSWGLAFPTRRDPTYGQTSRTRRHGWWSPLCGTPSASSTPGCSRAQTVNSHLRWRDRGVPTQALQ